MRFAIVLAVVIVVLALPAGSATTADCGRVRSVADPEGDVSGLAPPALSPADLDGMDFTRLVIAPGEEGVRISISLVGDPRADPAWHFYFWVSFEGPSQAGGNPPTWTIQRSTSYEQINSMYFDNRYEYPVGWENTTFSFTLPWEDLEAVFGNMTQVELGAARASASGPYVSGTGNAVAVGSSLWGDWVRENPGSKGPLRCPEEVSDADPSVEGSKDAPFHGVGLVGLLLALAVVRHVRRD